MNEVIADAGFWIALLNRDDVHHAKAAAFHKQSQSRYVTTSFAIAESCAVLTHRNGAQIRRRLVALGGQGAYRIADHHTKDYVRFAALMEKYEDLPMDLADASLVSLAEDLGHGRIVSTDLRDFRTYRWKNRRPFENLLFPTD